MQRAARFANAKRGASGMETGAQRKSPRRRRGFIDHNAFQGYDGCIALGLHFIGLQMAFGPRAYVYILASRRNGTLYVGSTTNLEARISEHRQKLLPGFTRRHDVTLLVWYDEAESIHDARDREHAMKRWRRAWKIHLIEEQNPEWRDLAADWGLS
jgi:putative endonuclease